MAKKRQGKQDEVMLIPFLDILCSLIGVLILIVVVVCVAQMQKINGRTKEDVERSAKYQEMLRQLREQERAVARLNAKMTDTEKRRLEEAAKQRRLEELRRRLALAAQAGADKEKADRIRKEIQELIQQTTTVAKAIPPLEAEIAELKKRVAVQAADAQPRVTVVRPYGSGTRDNQPLFFVEATGAGIIFTRGKSEPVRVTRDSVGTDEDYNAFLEAVKGVAQARLIFLIRKDGWASYLRAAGWAEQDFGLNTGKLPIPGDGVLDLSLFERTE
jgi:uncharacterized protein YlxW (UPF0749 family)